MRAARACFIRLLLNRRRYADMACATVAGPSSREDVMTLSPVVERVRRFPGQPYGP